jgi:hypothetical protein
MSSLWIGLADDGGGYATDYTVLRRFDQRQERTGGVAAADEVQLAIAAPPAPFTGATHCYSRS